MMKHRSKGVCCWLFIFYSGIGSCGASKGDDQEITPQTKCRLPVLSEEESWKRLPRLEDVVDRRLPIWAKALAGPLPQTTAAMLELDHLYRTSDAIDPRLRAKMRWVAARANRCAYSQRYAEADLLAAGMTRAEVDQWQSSTGATRKNASRLNFPLGPCYNFRYKPKPRANVNRGG